MDGYSAGVDGRHTRRRDDDRPFAGLLYQSLEERGFAGSGFARKKDASTGVLHKRR